MACGADSDTLGDLVLDAAEPAYGRGGNGPRDSCNGDGDNGDWRDAANLSRHDGTHGNRDGLGQERKHECFTETDKLAYDNDAGKRGEATCKDSGENRFPELLEFGNLPVEGNREHYGGGGEHDGNVVAAHIVTFEADSRNEQESHNQDVCD